MTSDSGGRPGIGAGRPAARSGRRPPVACIDGRLEAMAANSRPMRRVAVFGNAGGGKSTLARNLAAITRLPLYVIDMIEFRPGGGRVPPDEYRKAHDEVIQRDEWIIDGFGGKASAWSRFAVADTLIHVDLPLHVHYRWVTKRFIKGLFRNPEGWPENSPLLSSTIDSYRVVGLCHQHLTPQYRQLVAAEAGARRTHHLRSPAQIRSFLEAVRAEYVRA
jgi:adenylate kinase family enzyme